MVVLMDSVNLEAWNCLQGELIILKESSSLALDFLTMES